MSEEELRQLIQQVIRIQPFSREGEARDVFHYENVQDWFSDVMALRREGYSLLAADRPSSSCYGFELRRSERSRSLLLPSTAFMYAPPALRAAWGQMNTRQIILRVLQEMDPIIRRSRYDFILDES